MRSTIHLLSASDCRRLRPLMQPAPDAELRRHPAHAPALRGLDLAPALAGARVAGRAPSDDGRAAHGPGRPPAGHPGGRCRYACRNLLALVQVPPRGVWGHRAQVRMAMAQAWLVRPLERAPSIDAVVPRYLAAFGPASVADVSSWSRLTGMREVVERLRPRLRAFRDQSGGELLDLPDAPRPDPDTPALARFLPEYDNVPLSHADRSCLIDPERRALLGSARGRAHGSVLHDGAVCAVWRLERQHKAGEHGREPRAARRARRRSVAAEGRRLMAMLAGDAQEGEVRTVPLP